VRRCDRWCSEARQVREPSDSVELIAAEVRESLLSDVERGLADAGLAADVGDRRACVRLPERVGDLLLREFDRFIDPRVLTGGNRRRLALYASFAVPSI